MPCGFDRIAEVGWRAHACSAAYCLGQAECKDFADVSPVWQPCRQAVIKRLPTCHSASRSSNGSGDSWAMCIGNTLIYTIRGGRHDRAARVIQPRDQIVEDATAATRRHMIAFDEQVERLAGVELVVPATIRATTRSGIRRLGVGADDRARRHPRWGPWQEMWSHMVVSMVSRGVRFRRSPRRSGKKRDDAGHSG